MNENKTLKAGKFVQPVYLCNYGSADNHVTTSFDWLPIFLDKAIERPIYRQNHRQ